MNVEVSRTGRRIRAVFSTSGTNLEPRLESFGTALGSLVRRMKAGDEVEVSFERVANLPMVCSRELDRVVKHAAELPCSLRLTGLPSALASIYGPLAAPPAVKPPRKPRRGGKRPSRG